MSNVYDVKPSELVSAAAQALKEKIKKKEYINYVKSGAGKERPPQSDDFWYTRSASLLRQIYINGPVGVGRLSTRYGSKKEHTVHRKHHVRAARGIIRDMLQELENAKLVKKEKSGRIITPQGKSFLDKLATQIMKSHSQSEPNA
ncbi:MAG: 30S ribosomal protein S19e [Candidatus Micrarchaeaceae archaeon]